MHTHYYPLSIFEPATFLEKYFPANIGKQLLFPILGIANLRRSCCAEFYRCAAEDRDLNTDPERISDANEPVLGKLGDTLPMQCHRNRCSEDT
jgi:hypothetical protein